MTRTARTRRGHRAPPSVEGMEPRLLMATSGGRWSAPALITYSFAPDGTSIGGVASGLFSKLNAKFATATWQAQFQRAAAVWEAVAKINLAQVPDGGQAFGTSGYQQGDSRFGDIRIGGTPGGSGTLATTFLPPAFNGGTLAGDIVINTNQAWQINSDYDLQTVAIHELGHALGMDHSQITAADMYAAYNGMKQSLASDDTTSVQAIYGQRTADTDTSSANATIANLNASAQATLRGDVAAGTDADWFKVTVPASNSGTLTVTLQSTGLSSLSPKLTLYNGALTGLSTASSAAYGATVTLNVSGVTAGQVYYAKVGAGASGVSASGAYAIQFNAGSGTMAPAPSPIAPVPSQPDQGGGSANLTDGHGHLTLALGSLLGWGENLRAPSVPIRHRHDRLAPPPARTTDPTQVSPPITPEATPRGPAHHWHRGPRGKGLPKAGHGDS